VEIATGFQKSLEVPRNSDMQCWTPTASTVFDRQTVATISPIYFGNAFRETNDLGHRIVSMEYERQDGGMFCGI
jgi:hypothetical protein